jgi:hypothetical protein
MKCTLSQTSYEPGGKIHLRCVISEYGVPLEKTTSVMSSIKFPDGSSGSVTLYKTAVGVYEIDLNANLSGIYEFVVHAAGFTSRNVPFTREQVVTAAVWKGGDNPPSSTSNNPNRNPVSEAICKLLHCVSHNISNQAKERLQKEGFDINGLSKCLCSQDSIK